MTFSKYFWRYLFPAVLLFVAALWCGAQKTLLFALTGFLGVFLIAVSLVVEGWKKFRNNRTFQK